MLKKWIITLVIAASPYIAVANEESPKANIDSVDIEKVSQTLGHLIVRHLENPGFKFNITKIVEGINDELEGKASPMSEEEYEQTIALIQENLFLQLSETNLQIANAFLEKNAKESNIISINPKLQYKVLSTGEGEVVSSESAPLIHYVGKLADGTTFSSSLEGAGPISIPIKQTIAGFSEGLVGMKKGEKRVLYIHPELAYGVGGHLPPNSLLIFEVEVVETNSAEPIAKSLEEPILQQ